MFMPQSRNGKPMFELFCSGFLHTSLCLLYPKEKDLKLQTTHKRDTKTQRKTLQKPYFVAERCSIFKMLLELNTTHNLNFY